jgi:hypothetical protein
MSNNKASNPDKKWVWILRREDAFVGVFHWANNCMGYVKFATGEQQTWEKMNDDSSILITADGAWEARKVAWMPWIEVAVVDA